MTRAIIARGARGAGRSTRVALGLAVLTLACESGSQRAWALELALPGGWTLDVNQSATRIVVVRPGQASREDFVLVPSQGRTDRSGGTYTPQGQHEHDVDQPDTRSRG